VVALILDRFDREPYCILRVKAYVYDHRAEPRMQSDITARVKNELIGMGTIRRGGARTAAGRHGRRGAPQSSGRVSPAQGSSRRRTPRRTGARSGTGTGSGTAWRC
jgi:hypothetical protein